ncbi:unnamed protein product [Gadus morhua 'NCC']
MYPPGAFVRALSRWCSVRISEACLASLKGSTRAAEEDARGAPGATVNRPVKSPGRHRVAPSAKPPENGPCWRLEPVLLEDRCCSTPKICHVLPSSSPGPGDTTLGPASPVSNTSVGPLQTKIPLASVLYSSEDGDCLIIIRSRLCCDGLRPSATRHMAVCAPSCVELTHAAAAAAACVFLISCAASSGPRRANAGVPVDRREGTAGQFSSPGL